MDLNIHPPLPRRKDFRIGILGSGFIVDECHLVAYRKAGFNPVAIASRNPANAAKVAAKHNISKVHNTYDDLLADPSIEVLDIAVPPNVLLWWVRKACERRTVKGILAQKPLGMNYAEAVEIVEVCEKAGITLAVNQNMRFDQSVRAAKTLLDNGTIGEPVIATIEMRGIPHWQPWQSELGWLTLRIMSIHHLDTFRYWFDSPQRIFCSTRTDPRTKFPHTDGICTYILEYASGLRCIGIDDTWTGPAKEGCPSDNYIRWRIEGTNGLAIGDIGWVRDPYTTPSTIRYAAKGSQHFESPVWSESWFPDAFIGTMADLLIALENNAQPTISGRDNLKTMDLVEAAYESAHQRQAVSMSNLGENPLQKPHETIWKKITNRFRDVVAEANPDPLSNFTPRALQVLALARKEADQFNHNFVGTEHLLLGLIKLGQGAAAYVLLRLGLDLTTVRTEVEKQIGKGPGTKIIGNIPYTPRVKKVLALAAKHAKLLNHTYIGTEHILLGLLEEGDGVAARVLKSFRIQINAVREEILNELDPERKRLEHQDETQGDHAVQDNAETILEAFPGTGISNFTPRSQQAMRLAKKEAETLSHEYIGPEHLLLGLLGLRHAVVAKVLYRVVLNIENVRVELEKHSPRGQKETPADQILPNASLKSILPIAAADAKKLDHTYVGTEHLLLGLLHDEDGVCARILKNFGTNPKELREEVLKELDPNYGKRD